MNRVKITLGALALFLTMANSSFICLDNQDVDMRYMGCFRDKGDPFGLKGRDLFFFAFGSYAMTPNLCIRECAKRGFRYAGVQYGTQCFCGNSYGSYGRATNCDMECSGDKSQMCGGSWANSVYKADGLNVSNTIYKRGVELGVDRKGSDYRQIDLPYPDYRLCQEACIKDIKCMAWTYVKPYTIQGSYAKCWLKSSIPKPTRNNSCISGVK